MPLRLGIDLQSAIDDLRGMGRVVRTLLICFLRDYPRHDYFLFAKNESQLEPLRQLVLSLAPESREVRFAALPELRGAELDVCWYPWSRIDVTPRSGRRIVTIHDMARFALPYREFFRRWDQQRDEKQYRQAARLADQVLTISHFSAGEIEKYLNLPADRIPVVPLGVDAAAFASVPAQAPVLPREYHNPFLLFVGADSEAKNLAALLRAFALVKKRYPSPLSLICWGSGNACRKRHQKLLSESGINDDVFFPEPQRDDLLMRHLYRKAAMFVFPSVYEGFGLPPLEAMAAGTPVACSRSASLPEVVGDAALYFDAHSPSDMAEAVLRLLNDAGLCRELVDRGRLRIREFTWARSADSHMKIFEGSGSDSCQ